jgi:hypothetical protein
MVKLVPLKKNMKKLLFALCLASIGYQSSAQTLLTENFETYQGFGDALTGGWSTSGVGGFKVYLRGDTTINTNTKLCSININNNKRSDSLTTPTFGPLQENAVLQFRGRMVSYTGNFPTSGYVPSSQDKITAWISVNGGSFQFLQDIGSGFTQTGNKWNNFSLPLNGYSDSQVRVKFKVVRGSTNTEWNQDFDNFVATNLTTSVSGNLRQEDELNLYPNPATTDLVWLQAPGFSTRATVEVFNILGNKVASLSLLSGKTPIHLENLKNGLYIIKVTEGKHSAVTRLVVR